MSSIAGCICCGSHRSTERWPGFLVCSVCGLMAWDNHSLTLDESRKLYGKSYFLDGEYADYLGDREIRRQSLKSHLQLVRRFLPAPGRILEVGCAYGFFLELLQKDYPDSVGVDLSNEAITYAQHQGLDAREGDLLEQNLESGFDAACLWDTIEHLPHPDRVLTKVRELLRPGGYLFLTTGDLGALLSKLQGRKWRQIHPPTHLFYFTRTSLKALCEKLRFEVVRFGTVSVSLRLRSALETLHKSRPGSFPSRLAGMARKILPESLLRAGLAVNLGDTLYLVARSTSEGSGR